MNKLATVNTNKNLLFGLIMGFFYSAAILLFAFTENPMLSSISTIFLGLLTGIVTIRFPIFGFGLVIDSTILADLLPKTSVLSSIIPLIGVITIFSYFVNRPYRNSIKWNLSTVEMISLIFIIWVIISHPEASILGATRSWALTFLQLWLLLWMARQFIQTKTEHHAMMIILALGIIISGIVAILQVGSLSALSIENRAEGLSGGANTAARYFLYGIIILFYLQGENKKKRIKWLIQIGCIILLTVALFLTESRSVLLLLLFFAFLQIIHLLSKKQNSTILIILVMAIIFLLINQTKISTLKLGNIVTSIVNGSDTVGYRYTLWNAGIKMALDHPLAGVGIGKFGQTLPHYWPIDKTILANTAHNTYIEVLAETGIIGFTIFISLLVVTILKYVKIIKKSDKPFPEIYGTWLILLVVLLIGSLTKADLIDKFFWFLLGLEFPRLKSYNQFNTRSNRNTSVLSSD